MEHNQTGSGEVVKSSKKSVRDMVNEGVRVVRTVSVEPAALLLMASVLMSYLIFQNVMLENICLVRYKLDPGICKEIIKANQTYKDHIDAINTVLAETKIYRSVLDHTFPILYVILAGPLSDFYGRKIPLMIPILGFTTQTAIYLIFSHFYIDSMDPFVMNVLTSLPRSLTGGEVAYAMAAYSYICDITTHSSRTVRSGLLSAAYTLGVPVGFSLGGYLAEKDLSYPASFAISIAFSITGLLIILFRAKNTTKADRLALERLGHEVEDGGDDDDEGKLDKDALGPNSTLRDVLNPKNNLFKVIALPFRERENSGRSKFLMLLIAFLFSVAPIHGEFGVIFLFVSSKLGWDVSRYGYFSSVNTIIGVAGVILSMGILSKWWKLSDPLVGFIAGISQMAGSLVYAFICTSCGYMIYLASTIDMMNGTMVVIARSMMSKIVMKNEVGQLFSLIAILETLAPLVMDPTYSKLYHFTSENFYFLGWFFILSAALTIPPQIVYMWLIIRNYIENNNKTNDSSSAEEPNKQILNNADSSKVNNGHANLAFSTDSDSTNKI